ncbi:MAG: hypothetical protein GXY23_00995 [Myxococcales bacterium]|nr:hypothetical protein [Myxococcales bacterium]
MTTAAQDDEALARALDEACEAFGLRGDDRYLVASLLDRPLHTWPSCCGSGCSVCMDDVVAAAERVLAHLGRPVR